MGKSLKVKFEEQGIKKEEVAHAIRARGLLPVADERGCSFEALKNYAETELGIQNPSLLNKDYLKSNKELIREFIFEMHDIVEELRTDNKRLREEIRRRDEEDARKDALAKVQLIEMLGAVRT